MLYCVQYWVSLQQVYMYIVCMVFIVSTLFIHTVKELILTQRQRTYVMAEKCSLLFVILLSSVEDKWIPLS